MSIITLFNPLNPVSALNAQSASYYSESEKNISEKFKNIKKFEPPIDFTTASNWCLYGSLELYYEYGFKKVYQTYPYDGSAYEKNLYRSNSSQIDNYIFDKLYPKSTGYAIFLSSGFVNAGVASAGGVKYYLASNPEYITTFGGPHTASAGMEGKPLQETFDDSNKYDVALRRESNLEFDFAYGNTIEFWMNKGAFPNADGREVIFDLTSESGKLGVVGRLTIELEPGNATSPFVVTVESGSSAETFTLGSDITTADLPSSGWHHYAFAFVSSSVASEATRVNFFYDGNLVETQNSTTGFARVTGSLKSLIGALSGPTTTVTTATKGYGQFSGSLDEFRYWKYDRPADLVKLNYFKGIDGGTNTDDESYQLGVYYKFNEGITQTASVDSIVLDYSGRISNGVWTGYDSSSRNTGSAITLSGIETEIGDPIVRSNHPTVVADMESLRVTGSHYDQENNTYFYNLFPQWVREEDLEKSGLMRELAHIGASYFDTIHHQIRFYKDIKNAEYLSSSAKPITFADSLVENLGLTVPNLFINPKIYEKVLNQDENELYDMTMFDVKNQIYHNIYNNIHSILKSKGTVDAMRNFLRSFGVNEEIVKLRMYTDKDSYFLNDNYKLETRPVKFVNFSNTDNINASIIHADPANHSDINYVEFDESGKREKYSSFTVEANIMFPKVVQPGQPGHVGMNNIESSLFGFHRPDVSNISDYTWQDSGYDLSNLQVFAVKTKIHSKDVRFQLRDNGATPVVNLTSPLFQEVYDNTTWNISIRLKPSGSIFYGYSNYNSISPISDPDFILEFYGTSYINGEKQRSFHETQVLNTAQLKNLMHSDKRFYVGAHRENFTGSVLQQADTRVSAFRFWHSHLSNTELDSHARDITSYGVLSSSQNPTLFEDSITSYFPKMDSLVLNWNFESVTESDVAGTFRVNDISSGSAGGLTQYGWHSASVGVMHGAQGINFKESSSKVTDKEYAIVAKNPEPGNALLDDLINIRPEFKDAQTDYNDVTDNFFSIEKSPYAVLSTEMLKFFSLSRDLNYLVGNPSNRYRMEYKELGDLRDIYFRNIENEPDVERFFDYYKWIDLALNKMINQLIPFSTRHSDNVSNVIESHLLERPKYRAIMPLLEEKTATEAAIQSHTALTYNWRTGHAPAPRVSTPPSVADRNLSFLRLDAQGTNPNIVGLRADWTNVTAAEAIRTFGGFQFSFWLRIGNTQANTVPLITFKDENGNSIVELIPEQNTLNTDSVNLVLRITDPASGVVVDYGDTSPFQQNSITEGEWRHVSIFIDSDATNAANMIFKLYLDGAEITPFGNLGSTPVPTHLILPYRIVISQIEMSVSLDEFVLLQRGYSTAVAATQASTLYNNGEYLNVVERYDNSSTTFSTTYLLASWRFGDEEGNTYFPAQASNFLNNQQILDVTPNGIHLNVSDIDGSANILQGALTGPPFDTGAAPLEPGSTTGAGNPNVNCFWQKARKERTGSTAAELSIADERESIRKIVNDVQPLVKPHNLYDIQSAALYDGSTFVRKKRNKPYSISVDATQNIHGGINYANKKDKLLFHNALEPHGELGGGAPGVPQNIIGVGMDAIAGYGDGIVSPVDCDDEVHTKVNFSSNATLGKFYGEEYREKIKGHSILPMNLKNEVVNSGYNSKVNSFYRFDVVFTNLHTDTIDSSNVIPMQGPFTETHVGGHQSRHVPINKFDDSMPSSKQLEVLSNTGGAQATGVISFVFSDISLGDTITLQDSDGTSLVTTYSSNYDIQEGKWTSPDELIHIIETRLDITVLTFDLNPVQLTLVQSAYGTDGNKTISTSNPAKITVSGFTGGQSPGTNSTFLKIDSRKTRPEGWGLLLKEHQYLNTDPDGAFGFVGADYGQTYPYVEALRATRFREEHAKRPVNVKNIAHNTSSGIMGNYDRGLDIVQIPRDGQMRWFRDAYELNMVLPTTIRQNLPITTHYHTLMSQQAIFNGNVFSNLNSASASPANLVIGNNRQGDGQSFPVTNAGLSFTFDCSNPPETSIFELSLSRAPGIDNPLGPNETTFRFALGATNRETIFPSGGNEISRTAVEVVAGSWPSTITNFIDCLDFGLDTSNNTINNDYAATVVSNGNVAMYEFFVRDTFFAENHGFNPAQASAFASSNQIAIIFTDAQGNNHSIGSLIITDSTPQSQIDKLGEDLFIDPCQDWNNLQNSSIVQAEIMESNGSVLNSSQRMDRVIKTLRECLKSMGIDGNGPLNNVHEVLGLIERASRVYSTVDGNPVDLSSPANANAVAAAIAMADGTNHGNGFFRIKQQDAGSIGNTGVQLGAGTRTAPLGLTSFMVDTNFNFIDLNDSSITSNNIFRHIKQFNGGDDNITIRIVDDGALGSQGNGGTILDIDLIAVDAATDSSNTSTSIHPVSNIIEVNQTSQYVFANGVSSVPYDNIITSPQYTTNSMGELYVPSSFEINTRFSAPGGPEIQTISYLDAQSQTFSVYNALPYRNLTVRGPSSGEYAESSAGVVEISTIRSSTHVNSTNYPYGAINTDADGYELDRRGLQTLLRDRMGKAGTDHRTTTSVVESSTYPTMGSFHKQHSNRTITSMLGYSTGYSVLAPGLDATVEVALPSDLVDNGYFCRPIPSQDYGYSWVANLYAQGSVIGANTDLMSILSSPHQPQRTTGFTPQEYINTILTLGSYDTQITTDGSQAADSAALLIREALATGEAARVQLPVVIGHAPASGMIKVTSTTDSQFAFLHPEPKDMLVSAHMFPTISDVSCCVASDATDPTITVTTPDQDLYQDGVVVSTIPGTSTTSDFSLEVEEDAEDVNPPTNGPAEIWEQKIEDITYDGVSNDDCCPPDTTKYAMTVHGTQFDESSQEFSESADPGAPLDGAYSTTKPNFPSFLGSDVKINCQFGSEVTGDDLGLATIQVVVTIYAKDCQDRVTSLQITFLDAYWEAV